MRWSLTKLQKKNKLACYYGLSCKIIMVHNHAKRCAVSVISKEIYRNVLLNQHEQNTIISRRRHSQHRLISCARLSQAVDCACCLAGLTAQRVESCFHSSHIFILIQVSSSSSSRLHNWHWVVGSLKYTARLSCTQTCMIVCGYICRYAESFHRLKRDNQMAQWHTYCTVIWHDTTSNTSVRSKAEREPA